MTDYKAIAKEIVEKFYSPIFNITNGVDKENDAKRWKAAKACALIYVEGMMEMTISDMQPDGQKLCDDKYFKDYWQAIKKEIEALK